MKRFLIERAVLHAEGSQTFYVDAESEAEALKRYAGGCGGIYSNDAEVTALGEPEVIGETTMNDFGDCDDR